MLTVVLRAWILGITYLHNHYIDCITYIPNLSDYIMFSRIVFPYEISILIDYQPRSLSLINALMYSNADFLLELLIKNALSDLFLRDPLNLKICFLMNDFYNGLITNPILEPIFDHEFKLNLFDCFNSVLPFSVYQSPQLQELFSKLKLDSISSSTLNSSSKNVGDAIKTSQKIDLLNLLDARSTNNYNYSSINPLELFGLSFVYDPNHECYQLSEEYFDLKELI